MQLMRIIYRRYSTSILKSIASRDAHSFDYVSATFVVEDSRRRIGILSDSTRSLHSLAYSFSRRVQKRTPRSIIYSLKIPSCRPPRPATYRIPRSTAAPNPSRPNATVNAQPSFSIRLPLSVLDYRMNT